MRYITILLAVALSGAACSQKTIVLDYGSYPQLPMTTPIKIIRAVAKKPLSENKSFWGNYGGPGNNGGPPTDAMDELFRLHDISYLEATSRKEAIESDRNLVEKLQAMEETKLDQNALRYRKLAVGFFSSSISRIIGKPLNLTFGTRRRPVIMQAESVVVKSGK